MSTESGKLKVAGDLGGKCLRKKNGSQMMGKNGLHSYARGIVEVMGNFRNY